jgi:4-diphosphocytidyl-2-C-methyl-D-erythritol kinase
VQGDEISPEQCASVAGPNNLAYRAAELVLGLSPETKGLGFRISIEKRIPIEAGLGGGSSNAAAVIALLTRELSLSLNEPDLSRIAAKIGSDVPCLIDPEIKIVSGRGEQLTPLRVSSSMQTFLEENLAIGLVKPPRGVSTAEAYGWLARNADSASSQLNASTGGLVSFLEQEGWEGEECFAEMKRHLHNDFQDPVAARHAGVNSIIEAAKLKRNIFPLLSGSGSTVILFAYRNNRALGELLTQFAGQGFFTCETAIALS